MGGGGVCGTWLCFRACAAQNQHGVGGSDGKQRVVYPSFITVISVSLLFLSLFVVFQ